MDKVCDIEKFTKYTRSLESALKFAEAADHYLKDKKLTVESPMHTPLIRDALIRAIRILKHVACNMSADLGGVKLEALEAAKTQTATLTITSNNGVIEVVTNCPDTEDKSARVICNIMRITEELIICMDQNKKFQTDVLELLNQASERINVSVSGGGANENH